MYEATVVAVAANAVTVAPATAIHASVAAVAVAAAFAAAGAVAAVTAAPATTTPTYRKYYYCYYYLHYYCCCSGILTWLSWTPMLNARDTGRSSMAPPGLPCSYSACPTSWTVPDMPSTQFPLYLKK